MQLCSATRPAPWQSRRPTRECEDRLIVRNRHPDARPPGEKLAFYVTSHGFGHLNRAVAVINKVPPHLPVVIRSHPNLFAHWRERLIRPAELTAHVSDAGAINPPGNSTATDGPATLELAMRVHAEAMARLDEEAQWLRDERCRRLALRRAGRSRCWRPGVPAFPASCSSTSPGPTSTNPTHAPRGPTRRRLVADLRFAYRQATTVFRAEPALRMAWLPGQINVGMVANPGRDRRKELHRILGLELDARSWSTSTSAGTARTTSTGRGSKATPPGESTSSAITPRRSAP